MQDPTLDERVRFLRPLAPWAALSEETLGAVASAMQAMHYRRGEVVIRQGDRGAHIHVLYEGRTEVRVRSAKGAVVTVAAFHPGDCFGEMSLLSGDPTSADVVAADEAMTLALERESFNALVAVKPDLLRAFVGILTNRLRATNVAVGAARDKEREIAQFLHEDKSKEYDVLVGKHTAIKELQREVDRQALLDCPLLIEGERGTGKELIVRLIHFRSSRRQAPLLSADCAQIAETPWGDRLFGDRHQGEREATSPQSVCYMDLAAGGTILLKNIDALPMAVQQRLARFLDPESAPQDDSRPDVRIIVTCRHSLGDLGLAGRVSPALLKVFSEHVVAIPPLRDRKRDIPDLAAHFIRKHAERLNKQVAVLEDRAVTKMVSYDYRIGNVRELEEAMERAVILTDDEIMDAEEILLGPPPASRPGGINLLGLPKPVVRWGLRLFPLAAQILTAIVFASILYECLFGRATGGENLGTGLVWMVWWPMLPLMLFVAGRIWCAICPMALAAGAAQRVFNLKWRIPAWMKNYDMYIMMTGFCLVIWVEETTGMRHSTGLTAALLLVILGGALITSALFPRRAWCRYICPLGGFARLCSTCAVVELRPTSDVCVAKCKDHSCYKGDERVAGCPMFNHVMFVDTNEHCVLCMNCVRSCPNDSPRLNIRMPARELWNNSSLRSDSGRFIVLLLGLLVGLVLIQYWDGQSRGLPSLLLATHRFLSVSAVLALSVGAPLLVLHLMVRRFAKLADAVATARFWQKAAAGVPLVTAGFACYELGFVPGLDTVRVGLSYVPLAGRSDHFASVSMYALVSLALLLAGLVSTACILWNLPRDKG